MAISPSTALEPKGDFDQSNSLLDNPLDYAFESTYIDGDFVINKLDLIGFSSRVLETGQVSIQFIQEVHSSETTRFILSTLINDGQTLVHREHLIHESSFLFILFGLSRDAIPNKAP